MNKPASLLLWLVCVNACGSDSEPASALWSPLAASERYNGKTIEEWAVEWTRWGFAQTECEKDTRFDKTGEWCGEHQPEDAPVFFFDSGPMGTVRSSCRVPEGKAIVLPVAMYSIDNAGEPEPTPDDELLAVAMQARESARDMVLELDGHVVSDLDDRRIGPLKSSYHVPPAPNWFSCHRIMDLGDVTVEPVFISGVLVVLPPPEPGEHTVRYGATLTFRSGNQVRYEVTSHFHVD
jgi:hypothetical protein